MEAGFDLQVRAFRAIHSALPVSDGIAPFFADFILYNNGSQSVSPSIN